MIKSKFFINNSPEKPSYFEQDLVAIPRENEFIHYQGSYYLVDSIIYTLGQEVDVEINLKATEKDPTRKRVKEVSTLKLDFG
ncbi:hypothetical protein [Pseudoalteromonas piscicida]|uniref:Uncharacterized protein n=1 Tax=Pseudoalteromonas piscicida TaxID=43662 RepID=A0A2A5JLZ0_PSEO7|nr:hypothetical protein [Pseudoalteromonas piscicida]PCK30445.1 hypothetical protein CEX98_17625 [Pseudoalteromonas piscicida]